MSSEQILMGMAVTVLCGLGLWKGRWFLENTEKGRRMVRRLGPRRALWVLQLLLGVGALFGVLLATNVIRPMQW